jgi:outer membrane protein insertion porin family
VTPTEGRGNPLRILRILAVLCFLAPAGVSAGDAGPDEAAPVIGSISFQVASPYWISYEELAGIVPVQPGNRLTRDAIRESIRRLNRKNVFLELAAYVREEGGKTHILFYLRPLPVVAEIEVKGQRRVPASQILGASRLRRGAPAGGDDLSRAQESVLALLREKGFLEASASVSAVCNMNNGTGKVRIEVREGGSALVREVRVPGGEYFPRDTLEELLGVSPGFPFDFRRWEKGVNRLRGAYKRAGFLTVRVSEPEVSCEDRKELCLTARVEEGPRYEITWEGAERFSVGKLEKVSGIYAQDQEVSEAGLVYDTQERLLSFYRGEEYLKATVDVEAGGRPEGGRFLDIVIQEGKAGYLKEIRFMGNASIPDEMLRKQMFSTKRGTFHYFTGSGKFDEEEWNADLAALIGLYQKQGFARARISSVDTDWGDRGGITATIHIQEGERYRLREIRFQGNDHFLREELLRLIGNREGEHADYAGMDEDGGTIAAHYRNAGYLDVSVESRFEIDEGEETAVIRFVVEEGPRYRLGKVNVRGNLLTDSVVISRELTIPEGGAAGEKDLLTFQRAVFGTGLYKTVRFHQVKRPDEGILDLIVEVEETVFFEYEFGAGYGTDTGLRGFVAARQKNMDRRGRNVSARIYASEKEKYYLMDLREPWVFGNRWKFEGGVTALYHYEDRRSYDFRKTGVGTSINKTILTRSSVSLQYELSRENVFNVQEGAILSREDQGSALISAVRGVFLLELRDDPFNPKRGSFYSGSAEVASSLIGSEVDYFKLVGQASYYVPVFWRNTFVVSGRAGWADPFGDTVEVPIQKRFFLGGRTTVRGFAEDGVGPVGADGAPTGGDYMVNGNVELRVPLQYKFILALFLDAGSVWFQGGPPGYGFDLRESVGLGIRYVTPIGPLALEYGWKLDRREGEPPGAWHFTIGGVF